MAEMMSLSSVDCWPELCTSISDRVGEVGVSAPKGDTPLLVLAQAAD